MYIARRWVQEGVEYLECAGIERSLCAVPSIYMIYTPFRYTVCDPIEYIIYIYVSYMHVYMSMNVQHIYTSMYFIYTYIHIHIFYIHIHLFTCVHMHACLYI